MTKDSYVDLDFLGYGVARHPEVSSLFDEDVYLTVLSKQRLYKMLAFDKQDFGNEKLSKLTAEVKPSVSSM